MAASYHGVVARRGAAVAGDWARELCVGDGRRRRPLSRAASRLDREALSNSDPRQQQFSGTCRILRRISRWRTTASGRSAVCAPIGRSEPVYAAAQCILTLVSVKLHLRDRRTKRHARLSVCLFVCCVCRGRSSYGGTKRDASYKFMGRDKNPESSNKYTKFGQLIIRKVIKILPPDVTY